MNTGRTVALNLQEGDSPISIQIGSSIFQLGIKKRGAFKTPRSCIFLAKGDTHAHCFMSGDYDEVGFYLTEEESGDQLGGTIDTPEKIGD